MTIFLSIHLRIYLSFSSPLSHPVSQHHLLLLLLSLSSLNFSRRHLQKNGILAKADGSADDRRDATAFLGSTLLRSLAAGVNGFFLIRTRERIFFLIRLQIRLFCCRICLLPGANIGLTHTHTQSKHTFASLVCVSI